MPNANWRTPDVLTERTVIVRRGDNVFTVGNIVYANGQRQQFRCSVRNVVTGVFQVRRTTNHNVGVFGHMQMMLSADRNAVVKLGRQYGMSLGALRFCRDGFALIWPPLEIP